MLSKIYKNTGFESVKLLVSGYQPKRVRNLPTNWSFVYTPVIKIKNGEVALHAVVDLKYQSSVKYNFIVVTCAGIYNGVYRYIGGEMESGGMRFDNAFSTKYSYQEYVTVMLSIPIPAKMRVCKLTDLTVEKYKEITGLEADDEIVESIVEKIIKQINNQIQSFNYGWAFLSEGQKEFIDTNDSYSITDVNRDNINLIEMPKYRYERSNCVPDYVDIVYTPVIFDNAGLEGPFYKVRKKYQLGTGDNDIVVIMGKNKGVYRYARSVWYKLNAVKIGREEYFFVPVKLCEKICEIEKYNDYINDKEVQYRLDEWKRGCVSKEEMDEVYSYLQYEKNGFKIKKPKIKKEIVDDGLRQIDLWNINSEEE